MPTNPALRFLLALAMIIVGGVVAFLGSDYQLCFGGGLVLATFGCLDIFGFGRRNPNR